MPPRLEEMLREQNRFVREGMGDHINSIPFFSRVQLERVQYSTHYFAFIASATAKALAVRLFPSKNYESCQVNLVCLCFTNDISDSGPESGLRGGALSRNDEVILIVLSS